MLSAVLLVAVNLRGPIAAVSPVLTDLQSALGIGGSTAALLTTLPVLCFAVAAPAVVAIAARTGAERAILLGLAGIAVGTVLRSVDGTAAVITGTVLIGVAITVGNVLVPVIIKRDFPARVGSVTGMYTAALAAGAALTAALTAPIAVAAGWRNALASWGTLAVIAAIVWMVAFRGRTAPAKADPVTRSPGVWRSSIAWALALYLGAQSALYYSITAWLPTLLADDAGLSAGTGGSAMALYQLVGIVSTLVVPSWATRSRGQSGVALVVGIAWAGTLVGLLIAPGVWPLWSVTGGLAQGAGISLAFTLVILRARDLETVGSLSGMAQTVGYALGAGGPLLVGAVRDGTNSWTPPLVTLLALAGVLVATGAFAGRARTV
ncbi:MAG: MFS transporter [Haloechinothrix sp.]